MAYFLGIDGGGTRTTAWLADEAGKVLRRATAGPSNPLKVGFAAAQRELLRAARAALAPSPPPRGIVGAGFPIRLRSRFDFAHPSTSARDPEQSRMGRPRAKARGGPRACLPFDKLRAVSGVEPRRQAKVEGQTRPYGKVILDAVCAGLAGVDRAQVHGPLLAWLRKAVPAQHHLLTVDAAIALRAALGRAPGIIVIAGTGSIAYGQDERGRILRAGGWGIPFDDLGSGYDLGRKAVAAALEGYDGRDRPTALARRVCRALRLKDITQVVLHSYPQHRIAALFPIVLAAARAGDPVARRLCQEAAHDLSELALALIRRFGWLRRRIPVVCSGGVFRSSQLIRRAFARHLREQARQARVSLLRREPVEGALALAREMALPCR